MKTLLKNGTLVTASDTIRADILLDGETIALIGQNLPGDADAVVDISGQYILPGAIDVHTHLELPMMGTCSSDDFYTAKIFGMYPCKGTIAVGSDADIAIWDPALKKTMAVATSHQRTDYNLYEGMEVTGWPDKVYSRGRLLVDGDLWHGKPGTGKYIHRSAHAPVI